jgi:hypothetical protein
MFWFDVCLWYSYVLLISCCLVVLLFCCPHAPLPCLHPRLAVVVLAATHPIPPHYAPTLVFIARRLLRTISNSVPYKRAFSTIKLNHTRDRNRLKIITIDMLYFIHINKRILDKEKRKIKITHIADLEKTEEIKLKNIIASLGDSRP